jgi:tRNA1(Val) A37 N6-methylase TrmN6
VIIKLFKGVPFLNGGLFDCLDSEDTNGKVLYLDGFSRNPKKQANVPDELFFSQEKTIDLSGIYDDKKKKNETVKGLFEIFSHYKFTITENTPIEEEVALDPELLGRVFENLLASYNPETKTTARKQTGSFYTPREIVNYMVDESIMAYLKQKLESESGMKPEDAETGLKFLFGYNEKEHLFDEKQTAVLIKAIDSCKIIDPACGSGVFPMGILYKLVHILHKLDPNNEKWRELQRQKAIKETEEAFKIGNKQEREDRLKEISDIFENNSDDYGRKLYLIENCIFGVDIQPIATQISKLRFFISLIVDQKTDKNRENFSIRPLPNLETKFVAANTLIDIENPEQLKLYDRKVRELEEKLKEVRHKLFSANRPLTKSKLREEDQKLREEMGKVLESSGWSNESALQLAAWNPYDQNASSPFFDLEWMFGRSDGFDVVIGNPPYVFARDSAAKGITEAAKAYYNAKYSLAEYQINLYPLFIEAGSRALRKKGVLCFITPNNWLTINTNRKLRHFVLGQSKVSILNFYAPVFESADVDAAIVLFQNGDINSKHEEIRLLEWITEPELIVVEKKSKFLSQSDSIINIEALKSVETSNLIKKIETNSRPLNAIANVKSGLVAYEVGKGSPMQTKEMKDYRVYHSKHFKQGFSKYLDGRDVCRYFIDWSGEYIKYGKNLAAPRNDFKLYSTPRILVRQIPSKPPYCIHACFVSETLFNDRNSMNIINISIEPQLVLAVLNSRLTSYWFVHKFGKMQRGIFPQFKVNELAIFPMPGSFGRHERSLKKLVDNILTAKKNNTGADTKDAEQEIDKLVYALYSLSPEEIAIVEGK